MIELNFELARSNMIEQQIRPWDVLNQQVLDLLYQVPREEFVPTDYRQLAFADINIPLGHDQVMLSPKMEARLLQALSVNPNDRVLEIGTGSGYLTALLAKMANNVDSVDIFEDLVTAAKAKLKALGISNVSLEVGDAAQGWNRQTEYDVIVITGSLSVLPEHIKQQIDEGGCILAVVGEGPVMQAQLINHVSAAEWYTEVLFETWLPPLINAPRSKRFCL